MGQAPHQSKINIIEITDRDIANIGRWPWDRSWHATMVSVLKKLGVKYVYYDILFSEPSDEEKEDALLEASLKENTNVYLPYVFQSAPFDIKNTLFPLKRFTASLKGTGAMNIYRDEDGMIRDIPLLFDTAEGRLPHVAFKIALDYSVSDIKEVNSKYLIISGSGGDFRIPLVKKNRMFINWLGKWQSTFKHYSFLDVLTAYKNLSEGKSHEIDLKEFKDSICLIGVTAIGLYDIISVPMEAQYPGIGVIATTVDNIVNKKFIYFPPAILNILIIYLLVILPVFAMMGTHPFRESVFVMLGGMAYFVTCLFLFRAGIMINMGVPLLTLAVSSISVGASNFIYISAERKKFLKMAITDGLTDLYNIKYFKLLLETEIVFAAKDPEKKIAIIMGDVDNFKKFNDTYGHQVGDLVLREVANVMKSGSRSSDIVARYGGEEMITLLIGADLKGAMAIAEKVRKNIENCTIKDEKNTYKVTISFGVAAYKDKDTVDSIIKRADEGLYMAKREGKNRVSVSGGTPGSSEV